MSFSQVLDRWHDFYLLAGGASATLTGLLFVTVSFHLDMVAADWAKDLRATAAQTLTNFVYVLLISLVLVIPDHTPSSFFFWLFVLGIVGCYRAIRRVINALSFVMQQKYFGGGGFANTVWYVFLPALCYIGITAAALIVMLRPEAVQSVLYLLVGVILYLLGAATANAWTMLIRLPVVKREWAAREASRTTTANLPGSRAEPVVAQ